VRTGAKQSDLHEHPSDVRAIRKVCAVMEIFVLLFVLLVAVTSIAGLTADSRDSADWKPTEAGWRWRPRRS
jgi:hypothetical protein